MRKRVIEESEEEKSGSYFLRGEEGVNERGEENYEEGGKGIEENEKERVIAEKGGSYF